MFIIKNNDQFYLKLSLKAEFATYSQQSLLRFMEKQSTFPDAIEEIENNFIYEETQINDNILNQVVEYKFPISYEMNCL